MSYERIISHFGAEHQKLKAVEELGELSIEVCRSLAGNVNLDALKSEIADALNMIEQLKIIYNITDFEIHELRNFKVDRTMLLIDSK